MIIHTDRVSTTDPDALDITVKSASTNEGFAFAPEWYMVNNLKAGVINEDQYRENYLALLRHRYKTDPTPFHAILTRDRVVLTCYCAKGKFCHRILAAEVLQKIGKSIGVEVVLAGELGAEVKQISMFDPVPARYD